MEVNKSISITIPKEHLYQNKKGGHFEILTKSMVQALKNFSNIGFKWWPHYFI
jgi:hypothetical protein